MKVNVLGVHFDNLSPDEAVQRGIELVSQPGFHYVVTPNPEFVLAAEKDEEFRTVLNSAHLVIPDGIGVIYSAKLLGTPLKSRVPGIDFSAGMLAHMDKVGGRVYLLGAKPGIAEEAGRRIKEQYPNLTICGTHDGYFKEDEPVVQAIREAEADLLFVCLGAPRQEKFMYRYGPETGVKLAMGLGGSLDVYAGAVERAPERWQKLNLEWAYRLKKEPKRIGRMAKLPLVLVKAVKQRLSGKKEDN
ncbi:MAG: WecB/TagA/CpsF family glycosyltransferase [Oscillospiraceae bacterium]|nr:WecB/TagA/CpsF family glycosyltransferase [Oscillospiraceae bacterium]